MQTWMTQVWSGKARQGRGTEVQAGICQKLERPRPQHTVGQVVLSTSMPSEGVMGTEMPNIGGIFYSFMQKYHKGILQFWESQGQWNADKLEERIDMGPKNQEDLHLGTSLVAQCLRLCTPNAGVPGSIPGQGTRSHMHVATKSSHATTKELASRN